MFEQTFVEATPNERKPLSMAVSLMLQVSVVFVLILIPLLYTEVLPGAALKSRILAPVTPRAAVPEHAVSKAAPATLTRTLNSQTLFALTVAPKINPLQQTIAAPDIGIAGSSGGPDGADVPGVFSSTGSVPDAPVPAPAELQPKNKPEKQVRFGGNVAEANLIHKVTPVYPPLAKSARVQGAVEFTAVISKEGAIQNLQLVHGHPLLIKAAKEAVLQWRYRPTLLNGEPVEVITDIVVNFTLTQ